MPERLSAVVTAGGTREPIDDVRSITNFSTGRFGHSLAQQLVDSGFDVTIICPRETPFVAGGAIESATYLPLTDTANLQQTLAEQESPHLVFHAAAVSDYRPKAPVEGKIRSDEETMVIELERTPKILAGLRELYGVETFLVGFKLLSGVSRQELVDAALAQTKRNRLNLTVANDLQYLHDGRHPVVLVTSEGGAINLDGERDEVAANIVEFVRKRMEVHWYHTEFNEHLPLPEEEDISRFAGALRFAQSSHLLYDSSGNVSMRFGDGMIVTPRQVDKSTVSPDDAAVAYVDHESRTVSYKGNKKSSIDTAVADAVFKGAPNVKYLLHFHAPWGAAGVKTEFPYPCGAQEEGAEILSRIPDSESTERFAIELIHHGFLLGLQDEDLVRMRQEWQASVAEYKKHLNDIGRPHEFNPEALRPIFAGTEIIGVVKAHPDGVTPYIMESQRGRGVGRIIIRQLIQRQLPVRAADECEVADYYRKFGFVGERDSETEITVLQPPPVEGSDELFARIDSWKPE